MPSSGASNPVESQKGHKKLFLESFFDGDPICRTLMTDASRFSRGLLKGGSHFGAKSSCVLTV
jgi:hypothetical protein